METDSIEGFEDIINLETLSLMDHKKIDLSPLKNSTSLKNLILQYSDISDISFLSNLTNLEILSLEGTKVEDLSPLVNLKNLHTLYLNDTPVEDISVLKDLKNLEILDISETNVHDISPLRNLNSLHSLYVQHSKVENLKPLRDKKFYTFCIDEIQLKNSGLMSNVTLISEGIDHERRKKWARGHLKPVTSYRFFSVVNPGERQRGRAYLNKKK